MPRKDLAARKEYADASAKRRRADDPENVRRIAREAQSRFRARAKAGLAFIPKQKPPTAEVQFANNLKRNYGLTVAQYDEMFRAQGGVCAICKQPERAPYRGKPRRLAVDHCHDTKRVRGLLCCRCNRAIGLLHDDQGLLFKAIRYLRSRS